MTAAWDPMEAPRREALRDLGLAPGPRHAALLCALVHRDPDQARQAHRRWRREVDFEQVDATTFRLLPTLHRRLEALGVRDELTPRLEGVYKQALYRNHLLIHQALGLWSRLEAAGVPCLVLKGFPLLELYYRDRGARGMADVDLLVPEQRILEVRALLRRQGEWTAEGHEPWEQRRLLFHGENYRDRRGLALDLHWHLLFEACYPGADRPFWEASIGFDFRGHALRTLGHADALLLTVVHGGRGLFSSDSLVRWLPDAAALVEAAGDQVDWELLCRRARELHQVPVVEGALRLLADEYAVPVPRPVIQDLAASPVSVWDLRYLTYQTRRPTEPWSTPGWYWADFWMRLGRGRGLAASLPLLLPFLRNRMGEPDTARVLRLACGYLLRRLWLSLPTSRTWVLFRTRLGNLRWKLRRALGGTLGLDA